MDSSFSVMVFLALVSTGVAQGQTAVPAQSKEKTTTAVGAPSLPCNPTLLDGTPVKLALSQTISSAHAQVGDRVPFGVVDPVSVCGVTVADQGSLAEGTVTLAKKRGHFGRGGKLNVNIDWMRLNDGRKVTLRAVHNEKGGGHVGVMTGATIATAIVFFPAAPLWFFMHGKDVTIPKGTRIEAFTSGNIPVDLSMFRSASAPATPAVSSAAPEAGATTKVSVTSTPTGADISLDGNFVGQTPASLEVGPGDHVLTVTKQGFEPWSKKFLSVGGSVTLNVSLSPAPAAPKG